MAVTPAGAEVSSAVATNWKKIWKKNLKPLADKRYYTKAKSDAKYATKAESAASAAAALAGATSAANAATDSKLSGYYKKAESDARYIPVPTVIRGVWGLSSDTANEAGFTEIVYPQLAAAPTVRYIPVGGALPAGCSGTPLAPNASPGFLCIFEAAKNNMTAPTITAPDFSGVNPSATTFGATLWSSATGTVGYITGTYALRPAASGFSAGARVAPVPDGGGASNRP
jgi:hypothetical protein